MVWIYFTTITPYNYDNSFTEAFETFLGQCLINKDRLVNQLTNNNCYRFLIKTDDENDKIYCKNGQTYLKSRFMTTKNFKSRLISYYKPLGIYIKGPKEIIRRDGTFTKRWIIELTNNQEE
jgi:hypothetical protein